MNSTNRKKYNSYMNKYMNAKYKKSRAQVLIKLGGICVNCGTTNDLNIDHINPLDKAFSVSQLWSISEKRF